MESSKRKVFLSLPADKDHEDSLASKIKEKLEDKKFKAFYFLKDLKPGDDFQKEINKALAESQVMVALISESFLQSVACMAELKAFFGQKRK